MNKLQQYAHFDKIFWTTGIEPTIPSSEYKSDGTWLITDIAIGEIAINVVDDKVWFRSENGIIEYTTSANGSVIEYVTGTTYTLPAVSVEYSLTLKKTDTGTMTITPASGTIDGETTQYIYQYDAIKLKNNGTNWFII